MSLHNRPAILPMKSLALVSAVWFSFSSARRMVATLSADAAYGSPGEYQKTANDEILVIPMIVRRSTISTPSSMSRASTGSMSGRVISASLARLRELYKNLAISPEMSGKVAKKLGDGLMALFGAKRETRISVTRRFSTASSSQTSSRPDI
jgi:hypothetical protein